MKQLPPIVRDIGREAVIVVAGAVVAAWFVGQFPALKRWLSQQWEGSGK